MSVQHAHFLLLCSCIDELLHKLHLLCFNGCVFTGYKHLTHYSSITAAKNTMLYAVVKAIFHHSSSFSQLNDVEAGGAIQTKLLNRQ